MLSRLKERLRALLKRRSSARKDKADAKDEIEKQRERKERKDAAIRKLDRKIPQLKGKIKKASELDPHGGDVVEWEGKPVVEWIAYWLERSRKAGWTGVVNSGYRSPEYSEQLCYQICGAPSCPGRCAGRSSNHCLRGDGQGAVDVSNPEEFAAIQVRIGSPLFNALGAADPWHFSKTGR